MDGAAGFERDSKRQYLQLQMTENFGESYRQRPEGTRYMKQRCFIGCQNSIKRY